MNLKGFREGFFSRFEIKQNISHDVKINVKKILLNRQTPSHFIQIQ